MVRQVEISGDVTVQKASSEVVDSAGQTAEPVIVPSIEKPPGIAPSGFFNPRDPAQPYNILLRRLVEHNREIFQLEEPIGYWDHSVGGVIVPENLAQFRTDLTSVPRFFTWLVPTTGVHLPAALVHDGLVHDPGQPTYIADRVIDRETADRIFRDGMRDLGATWVRRWLVWTAVAAATMVTGTLRRTWWSWVAIGVTVTVIAIAGTAATIDLFDCRQLLPWMGDRPAWVEVLTGAVAAVVVPSLLSILWWPRWQAGVITGMALALLLHVTFAVVIVFALFSAIESLFDRNAKQGLLWAGLATVLIALPVLIGVWAC